MTPQVKNSTPHVMGGKQNTDALNILYKIIFRLYAYEA
jgi:hypothetical protein